jgi:hypothetical protein
MLFTNSFSLPSEQTTLLIALQLGLDKNEREYFTAALCVIYSSDNLRRVQLAEDQYRKER